MLSLPPPFLAFFEYFHRVLHNSAEAKKCSSELIRSDKSLFKRQNKERKEKKRRDFHSIFDKNVHRKPDT